jgi:hypothetical protein
MKPLALFIFLLFSFTAALAQKELPAINTGNKDKFFIPAATLKANKLKAGQKDAWMRVYNSADTAVLIDRVVDIRWQADSKAAAIKWYDENGAILNEGGVDKTSSMPALAGFDRFNIYVMSPKMREMNDAFGIKLEMYYFTFVADKYVGKIFVSGKEKLTLMKAALFAKAGLKATFTAAGRKAMADKIR